MDVALATASLSGKEAEAEALRPLCMRLSAGPCEEAELGDWWRALVGRRLAEAVRPPRAVAALKRLPPPDDAISCFFSVRRSPVSASAYAERVRRYSRCSEGVYLHALVLLRRAAAKDARLHLCEANVHRLFLAAVVVAAKFSEHAWYTNAWYARVGGISNVRELNVLELALLRTLDYRLLASPEEILSVSTERDI